MSEGLITGYQIYHGFLSGYKSIARHREHINRINVFPVPDGDTGNNMIRTIRSVIERLECQRSLGAVLEKMADLSLAGAHGNSGIILSQYLNGLAEKLGNRSSAAPEEFSRALKESVELAYAAMDNPREGTILTVLRRWADTVFDESRKKSSFKDSLSKAYSAARKALKRTPEQLPVLKENGVVDAAAWGFLSFIEGIERLNHEGPVSFSSRKRFDEDESVASDPADVVVHDAFRNLEFRYCTEMLVDRPTVDAAYLRAELKPLGDSLIVSKGKNLLRIHVHTNSPSQVLEIARRGGRVLQQSAEDMIRQEQVINRKAAKIAVLTDSIADIPTEILDVYQIHVINLNLNWDDENYLDRLTISPEEFYRLQAARRSFPGSSVPDRNRVDTLFEYLMDHYEGLIVLPVAKALSGTWQQLSAASERYNVKSRRIEVVDTCLNSVAQGLLVYEVAEAAVRGLSLEELRNLAENLKRRIKIYVSVSTFKYMVRGGRVSPLKGVLARLLNLKPIVSLDTDGHGIAFDKAFSARGLMRKLEALVRKTEHSPGIARYAVVHAAAPERARTFAGLVEGIIGMEPSYITTISPIVGMHSGQGAVAIGVIEKEE